MELSDYLRVLRRRWWMVLLSLLVCTGGAFLTSKAQTPVFTTSTRLLVSGIDDAANQSLDEVSRRQLASERAGAYAQLAGTGPAIGAAVDAAGANGSQPSVTAAADGVSPFIVITVSATSGRAAQAIAASYVEVLPQIVSRLEQSPSSKPPTLTTLEAAGLPTFPSSPRPKRDLLIGLVLGLVLGVAAAMVRESLDARVRDTAEIEKSTTATLLGAVPRELNGERLPAFSHPHSGRAEAYRAVRANLEFSGPDGMPRSLVVTIAAPGDGKSSLACNLAIVASRAGRSVVVVDADLRKPSVATYFGIQPPLGLTDALSGRWSLDQVLHPVPGERLAVLASGQIPSIPSELVGSAAMAALIEELEQLFELVIIDTPPVLPVSDALLIGVNTGGVVVVVRLGETTRTAMRRAIDSVGKVNATLLGVVGNAAAGEDQAYGYGYGYTRNERGPAIDLTAVDVQPSSRRQRKVEVAPRSRRAAASRRRSRPPAATYPPRQSIEQIWPQQPGQAQAPDPAEPDPITDSFDDILRPRG